GTDVLRPSSWGHHAGCHKASKSRPRRINQLLPQKIFMPRLSRIVHGLILFLAALSLWGQSFSGKIVGLVTDSSAAAIPRVAVTVVNEGTGAQRHLITDATGIYVAA